MGGKDTKGRETSERDSVLEVGTSDGLNAIACTKHPNRKATFIREHYYKQHINIYMCDECEKKLDTANRRICKSRSI